MKKKIKPSNKAVAYIRVSTKDQKTSLLSQEERIRAYCVMANLDLTAVLVEQDVSGKIPLYDRPEGEKIKELISSGCSHVVSVKLDRIFRNAADALVTSENWLTQGVNLHIIDTGGSNVNTGSSMGRMFLTILAGFAEFERTVISERTSTALQHKKANGSVYCPQTPYGLTSTNGKLVENKEESAVIEKMRELRSGGMGYRKIARELNYSGIKSKLGGSWYPYSVARILST
jgi:DNA invertase Pin-like site-specific DNA recombinase